MVLCVDKGRKSKRKRYKEIIHIIPQTNHKLIAKRIEGGDENKKRKWKEKKRRRKGKQKRRKEKKETSLEQMQQSGVPFGELLVDLRTHQVLALLRNLSSSSKQNKQKKKGIKKSREKRKEEEQAAGEKQGKEMNPSSTQHIQFVDDSNMEDIPSGRAANVLFFFLRKTRTKRYRKE